MKLFSWSQNKTEKPDVRRQNIQALLMGVVLILIGNILGAVYFVRLDLTSEKRYSITPATRDLLRNLDDIVYFRVYLEGDFPAGFRRLRNQTREILDEFRAYSDLIQYEFINPTVKGDRERTNANYQMLVGKGLAPTQLQVRADDATSQQIIFPGLIASYRGREFSLQLLQDQMGLPSEEILNNSAQALEYNLASVIYRLTVNEKPVVAFLEGNAEYEFPYVADLTVELEDYYQVERIQLQNNFENLRGVSSLVIARPMEAFTEQDKFLIDQFVMQGGSVLWLLDAVYASMDSLRSAPETIGMGWPLNLDDMLFRYGVRINADLLTDLQALPIPITTGNIGGRPQISMVPWLYFPLVSPASTHPMVRNLNVVKTEFVSSIDTVTAPGIRKIPLLQTSGYTRVHTTPVRISLDVLHNQPDERLYREGPKVVAMLLEGQFTSVFRNRMIPHGLSLPEDFNRRDSSPEGRMVVVADGDMARNQFDNQGRPLPLGFDKYLNQSFGNRDFILNVINYLNDDSGLMEARAKEIRLRMLDRSRVNQKKTWLQVINVSLPILLLVIFASIRFMHRRRRYGQPLFR